MIGACSMTECSGWPRCSLPDPREPPLPRLDPVTLNRSSIHSPRPSMKTLHTTFGRFLSFSAVLLSAVFLLPSSIAQSGSGTGELTGAVANAATKASLEGATVELMGTNRRTLTDASGTFAFYKLAPGSYTVSVAYPGLDVQTRSVVVSPGSHIAADFSLTSEIYAMAAFLVTSEREGNAAAILRQRNAGNIVNVVAIDAFGDIADGNLGNFMQRLPGVATQVSEGDVVGITLRGAPPQMGMTMLNGSRLSGAAAGDTGKVGDRASLIDRIPSEFI